MTTKLVTQLSLKVFPKSSWVCLVPHSVCPLFIIHKYSFIGVWKNYFNYYFHYRIMNKDSVHLVKLRYMNCLWICEFKSCNMLHLLNRCSFPSPPSLYIKLITAPLEKKKKKLLKLIVQTTLLVDTSLILTYYWCKIFILSANHKFLYMTFRIIIYESIFFNDVRINYVNL